MRLVRWWWDSFHFPMAEDEQQVLWTTSSILRGGLSMGESTLRELTRVYSQDLSRISIRNSDAKEFFRQNRVEFGIKRVRSDMRLWSEDDVILIAIVARNSRQFRRKFIEFVKQNARREYISKTQWNEMAKRYEELAGELADLKATIATARPALEEAGSAAGAVLAAQRGLKILKGR